MRCEKPTSAHPVPLRRWPRHWQRCARSWAKRELDEQLAALRVHPVFTAHPTEARRRAVTSALRRVGDQLEVLADPRVVGTALPETRRRLLEEVDGLWRTAQLRSQELQPLDEVRTLMGVFDTTLFRLVPAVYRELELGARRRRRRHAATHGTGLPPFRQLGRR